MKSILVALLIGVVGSLIAGFLLMPEDAGRTNIGLWISSAYNHWGWSLLIFGISLGCALVFSYRLAACLWIIERSAEGWEVVRQRMAARGMVSEGSAPEILVTLDYSLIGWSKEGDWRVDASHDPPDLRLTNSDKGIVLRKTLLWTDYEFQFETRIENANTAWIVRAFDLNNYVMLQCWPNKIIPHYHRDGLWWREEERPLPIALPEADWFRVCIRAEEEVLTAYLLEDGQRTVLFKDEVLGPRTANLIACRPTEDKPHYVDGEVFLSYLRGGVGFRESGNESASFRNISVRQIVDEV